MVKFKTQVLKVNSCSIFQVLRLVSLCHSSVSPQGILNSVYRYHNSQFFNVKDVYTFTVLRETEATRWRLNGFVIQTKIPFLMKGVGVH